jgi:hypothetical protein
MHPSINPNWHAPLSLSDFQDFFLVLQCACLLIKQDLGGRVTTEEAEKVRKRSVLYGSMTFPDDDEDIGKLRRKAGTSFTVESPLITQSENRVRI